MELSTSDVPLSQPRRALKRSASTASLPTPPRTHRRHKRGRSRGDCDSDSDKDDGLGNQRAALLSSDEEDELPKLGQSSHKKRKLSESKGVDGDEEAFWMAGPNLEVARQANRGQGGAAEPGQEESIPSDKFSSAPLVYRKTLRRSQSQNSNGLASPPPSHRKPQAQAPRTPPAGPSTEIVMKTQSASPPKTPKKQTNLFLRGRKGLKSPQFPVISDSPDNPFYVVPASPSPGEESESPRVDSVSPKTPPTAHEKPTMTYVFRGVRREYQNPLYNHAKKRPLSPPPSSLLPIEHPDYSPDMGCKPTVLFPGARKGKHATAAKSEVANRGSASTSLRRSPRRKQQLVVDSDDEAGPDVGEKEAIIKPRKLDFGMPKSVAGKTKTSVKSTKKEKVVNEGEGVF